jgi:myotubularin-related protein 6/7/8
VFPVAQEVSPIFLQMLECTWALQREYPKAFEFNETFLVALHDCLHSCKVCGEVGTEAAAAVRPIWAERLGVWQFGTFLGNCEQERVEARLAERTTSAWDYLYSRCVGGWARS